jgi:hypothetical protein
MCGPNSGWGHVFGLHRVFIRITNLPHFHPRLLIASLRRVGSAVKIRYGTTLFHCTAGRSRALHRQQDSVPWYCEFT